VTFLCSYRTAAILPRCARWARGYAEVRLYALTDLRGEAVLYRRTRAGRKVKAASLKAPLPDIVARAVDVFPPG
jgi:hypothetical protein